jgi:hypothetical protein
MNERSFFMKCESRETLGGAGAARRGCRRGMIIDGEEVAVDLPASKMPWEAAMSERE